jgi:hypothetical protein
MSANANDRTRRGRDIKFLNGECAFTMYTIILVKIICNRYHPLSLLLWGDGVVASERPDYTVDENGGRQTLAEPNSAIGQ